MAPTVYAEVRLHGSVVGRLTFDRGGSVFEYSGNSQASHAVIGQTFEEDPKTVRRAQVGLPPWFANLLPEGALRRYIERGIGGNVGDIRLLTRLGADLPGAVQVLVDGVPEDNPPVVPTPPDHPLRYSALAGVQLKFSVAAERINLPVCGDGEWWIVKLPDRSFQSVPTNEHLVMRWLRSAGFNVPPVRTAPARVVDGLSEGLVAPDELVYLIPRFDRTPDGPVHYEDFAQIADVAPAFKYRNSGFTYDGLGLAIRSLSGDEGFEDYVRRLVAMVVVGNTDAHLKNWAIIYPDRTTPRLAPVYDFHLTTIYYGNAAPLALLLAGEEMPGRITRDHFKRMAATAGHNPDRIAEVVAQTVEDLRGAWPSARSAGQDFEALVSHLDRRLHSLPLAAD